MDNGGRSRGITRRQSVAAAASALAALLPDGAAPATAARREAYRTRGVVLIPQDLSLADWPERAARAGIDTIALHPTPAVLLPYVRSEPGQAFLARCRELRLRVEYEMHAMADLLPRALHATEPDLFRMDERGDRVPDANLCVHSPRALAIAAENALAVCATLRPTTGRHFLWGDDGAPWCRCPRCRGYSDSDQALLLENHLVRALRRVRPRASLAHIAYARTLQAPTQVRPAPGIFLEFAPIQRVYDRALDDPGCAPNRAAFEALQANLQWFGANGAQALEYWLDVSRYSGWRRPAARIPWTPGVLERDAAAYWRAGVRRATTFAVWIDRAYLSEHGEPPLAEYGQTLRRPR